MSAIDDLEKKVRRLVVELDCATKEYHAALIEAYPFRVGDLVSVTTSWTGRETFEYGQVRSVYVKYDRVMVDIAPRTKTGFHANRTVLTTPYTVVNKIDAIPEGK